MTTWTSDNLTRIGATQELRIAPRRRDGTLRAPVKIWVVRHGDNLYVRSYNGVDAAWLRGTQVRHEGRIWADCIEHDVTFVAEPDPGLNDEIDAAYRTTYRRYVDSYVPPMISPTARATTLKLVPRDSAMPEEH